MRSKQLLTALGIILLLTGLALPAGSLGTTVSPVSLHHAGEVTTGLWLFKLMLVLHGGLLLAWGRLPLLTEGAALLSPRSLARGSEEPAWAAWAARRPCWPGTAACCTRCSPARPGAAA